MNMREDCSSISEWLSAYLDGELTAQERKTLESHLAVCPACRAELASLRQSSACLQSWQAPEANPALSTLFAERLAARAQPSGIWQRLFGTPWLRAGWAVGAMAALLLAGVFIFEVPRAAYQEAQIAQPITIPALDGEKDLLARGTDHPAAAPQAITGRREAAIVIQRRMSVQHQRRNSRGTNRVVADQASKHNIMSKAAITTERHNDDAEVLNFNATEAAMNVLTETSPVVNGAAVTLVYAEPVTTEVTDCFGEMIAVPPAEAIYYSLVADIR